MIANRARLAGEAFQVSEAKTPHFVRSQSAAEHFASLGFTSLYNLAGGIDAWSMEIDPSVTRY